MLRAFAAAGALDELAALLYGRPVGPEERFGEYEEALLKVVRDELGLTRLPVVAQMDFGHTDPIFTLPLGVMAEVDAERRIISIVESAVVRCGPRAVRLNVHL
jgi:muramoyltetrapeptide carboxypeptidase LdcA involved in peptidoglycan recycling